uniref:RING-type domain-containing protein n=1 Tax=Opuntia streptacantha TaxID=393608 RepID=A0A7C9DKA9_OPUST
MPRNNRRHVNAGRPVAGDLSRFRQQSSSETTPQPQTSPPPPPSKSNPRFLPLLLQALIMTFVISLFFVFVGVAAIIFLHLCIAGGALHRRHRSHRLQSPHQTISGDEESSSGCSLEELKNLPKSRFRGSETCAICLDNLLEGEICRILPSCNHVFHCNCVDKWLLKVPACPVCRSSVRSSNAEEKRMAGIDWEQLWAACE